MQSPTQNPVQVGRDHSFQTYSLKFQPLIRAYELIIAATCCEWWWWRWCQWW